MSDQTMHLAYLISPSDLNYALCSDYGKAVTSCLVAIADNIASVKDEKWQIDIITDIVNNRGIDAMDNFNVYHKENKTGYSVGFNVVDAVDADLKYERDRFDAFCREHVKWTE